MTKTSAINVNVPTDVKEELILLLVEIGTHSDLFK